MNAAHTAFLSLSIAATAGLVGCAGEIPPPAQKPPAELETPATTEAGTFDARWPVPEGSRIDPTEERMHKERLSISRELEERCRLDAVYFGFDSREPAAGDKAELAELAECFSKGPMRGKRLGLIGRADLTGDANYNLALGLERASRIKAILVREGVPASNIRVSSRGTKAVLGPFNGYTYGDDRRVDIVLLP